MSDRGRKPGFKMTEEHRVKIRNSNILNALIEHAEGQRDMSATQVTAGLGLLKKVLPDISQTQLTGEDDGAIQINVTVGGNDSQPALPGAGPVPSIPEQG